MTHYRTLSVSDSQAAEQTVPMQQTHRGSPIAIENDIVQFPGHFFQYSANRLLTYSNPVNRISSMTTECILWTGARYSSGYGQQRYQGKRTGAHRVAWMKANGAIPDGMEIDHLCNVRLCVVVEHMQLVTRAENMRLKGERQKFCKRGHLRTVGACKVCVKEYQKGPKFKAAVARWEAKNRVARREYQRLWQARKRAAERG